MWECSLEPGAGEGSQLAWAGRGKIRSVGRSVSPADWLVDWAHRHMRNTSVQQHLDGCLISVQRVQ